MSPPDILNSEVLIDFESSVHKKENETDVLSNHACAKVSVYIVTKATKYEANFNHNILQVKFGY